MRKKRFHCKKRIRVGIIPYTRNSRNEIMVLFGKELHGKWSPFGGGLHPGESLIQGGIREFTEEIMGLFDPKETQNNVIPDLTMMVEDLGSISHYYFLPTKFDPELPRYFRHLTTFLTSKTLGSKDRWDIPSVGTNTGMFEKDEIEWINISTLELPSKEKSRYNGRGYQVLSQLQDIYQTKLK